jgi:hypothetical protein
LKGIDDFNLEHWRGHSENTTFRIEVYRNIKALQLLTRMWIPGMEDYT